MAVNTIIKFLNAARSLANQGMSKEAIEQFARNEFGEISELFKKQIDSLFKPKKGIENIKIKDEVFDDTVIKLPVDDTGKPFNPRDPLKNYEFDPEDFAKGGRAGYAVGNQVMPAIDPGMNLDYNTLVNQNTAQRVAQRNMRGMGKSDFQTQPGTLSQGLGKIANDAVMGSMNLYGLDPSKAGVAQDPSMLEFQEIKNSGLPQKDYATASTYGMLEDMTEGNAFKRALAGTAGIAAVPLTYLASPIYDTAQAGYRAATNPDLNFLQALKNEKVGEMMNARTKGALQFVGDQFGLTNNRQDIVDSITKTPTYDSASAGAIITDGDSKYRINADGSRSLIGKIEDAPIIDRPTMADVAGPKEGYISLKEYEDMQRNNMYDFTKSPGNRNRPKEEIEQNIKNIVSAASKDPDNYLRNYMGNFDSIIANRLASGGRAGFYTGGMVDVEPNLSDIGHGSDALMARTRLVAPDSQATTSTGLNYLLAEDNDNIRVPFSKGKIAKEVLDKGRRGFMKAAGAAGAGIAALKTGLLGFGEKAAPVAKEVIETVSETAQGVPPYFLNLVSKIKNLGDETMATQDKAIAKKYKDYVMEEDFAGNITIMKKGDDVAGNKIEDVYMSLKVDEVPLKGKKGSTKVEEYEEFTARPDGEGKMKDVEPGVPDEVVQEGTMFEDNMTEFGKIKKADGGRIGFGKGDIVTKGIPALIKAGEGKFTKAQYLIERIKNAIKGNPDDKYVQETFPNFIKELEANPDLAKNENVFKELGGDLPEGQKIVVYGDDTLDFFTESSGPQNIKKIDRFMEKHGLSRDKALEIMKMEPDDQVMELTKRKFLKQKRTDNAQGGIQTMLGE